MTAAVFRAAVYNSTDSVPNSNFYILTGGQVTRGAEFNITGRVLPGVALTGGYTYTSFQAGDPSGVSRHTGSLWVTWDLPGERWQGWGAAVGVNARSAQFTNDPSFGPLHIPGVAQTDMTIYYHAKQWSSSLGIKNLFDRRLYDTFYSNTAYLQPGRLIYLTSRYSF